MGEVLHVAIINTEVDRVVILWIRRDSVFYFTGLTNSTATHLQSFVQLDNRQKQVDFILLVELEI